MPLSTSMLLHRPVLYCKVRLLKFREALCWSFEPYAMEGFSSEEEAEGRTGEPECQLAPKTENKHLTHTKQIRKPSSVNFLCYKICLRLGVALPSS